MMCCCCFTSCSSSCPRFDAVDEVLALEEREEEREVSRAGDGVGIRRVKDCLSRWRWNAGDNIRLSLLS